MSVSDAGGSGRVLPADGVDHLIYAVPDLANGIDETEQRLGTRPVIGGRHPLFGTHNALVSLGNGVYLEIIAPDPDLRRPDRGRLFGLDHPGPARLVTWVLRGTDIAAAAARAAGAGFDLGTVRAGRREKPDGAVLTWRQTDPYAMALDGALPFLMDWGETPHPSHTAPRAGSLAELTIQHPRPDRVRAGLAALGSPHEVRQAEAIALIAEIETPGGRVTLR